MKTIIASNNPDAYAKVDDDIFDVIQSMGLKFCIDKRKGYWYSTKRIQLPCMNKKKCLYLHHFVWILKTGEEPTLSIDHIDIDKSNNQYCNLRLATSQQQSQHQGKRKNNTSGYIGVCHYHQVDNRHKKPWSKDYWRVSIQNPDGKNEAKTFPFTEAGKLAAARYYDKKAIEYHGDFHGELNFPDDHAK